MVGEVGRWSSKPCAPYVMKKDLNWRSQTPEPLRDCPEPSRDWIDQDFRSKAGEGCDLYVNIEARLEMLFVQFSNARISRETFLEKVLEEYRAARRMVELIRQRRASEAISETESKLRLNQGQDAMAVARWCLEWADGLRQNDPFPLLRTSGSDGCS